MNTGIAEIPRDHFEELRYEYSEVRHSRIKSALTVLGANGLIHVERMPSSESDYGVSNAYRLSHLESHNHMGTRGRSDY